MRKFHRAVHFDFHTMPGIHNIAEGFDAAVFAQRLKDANVDYINFSPNATGALPTIPQRLVSPIPA